MARAAHVRPACRIVFAGLVLVCFSGLALGKDADDGDEKAGSPAKFENPARAVSAGCPLSDPKPPKPIEREPAGKVP